MSITFELKGDGKGFKALANDAEGFKKAVTSAVEEASRLDSRAINFAAISTAVDQAQSALNSLKSTLKDFASAYAVQEQAETQLATVMRQRMGATDAEIQSIKDLCSAQQKLGVIGDEVQLAGAQQVATFLTQKSSIETLIPAMNNLIAQQGGLNATSSDAVNVGKLLGKAMQGQTSALKRVGITFTEAQEQVMKYGTESERAATLAQVITDRVGNMNAELAKTDSGKQKQLENTLGDIKERLGALTNAALPFVTIAANTAIALGGIIKLVGGIKTAIAVMSAWNIKGAATSAMCKLVGVSSTKSAALVRVFSSAMHGGAFSATAFKVALRGLLIATGVGAAIAALTFIVEKLIDATENATDATDDLIDAQKRQQRETERVKELHDQETRALEDTRAALAANIAKLKAFNGSKAQEKKLVDEMNNTYGETMGYFSSVSDWYNTLIANSEDYCKQMVLEARTRMLANQIAQKQQENYDITHNADGSTRRYSTQRETRVVQSKNVTPLPTATTAAWAPTAPTRTEEIPGTSALDKAQAAYNENTASINSLTAELEKNATELAGITYRVRGSATAPTGGAGGGTQSTSTPKAQWKEDAANLKEIGDNLKILQDKLQTATIEEAAQINKDIELWNAKAEAIRNAGKAVEETKTPEVDKSATTLKGISDNINILQNQLLNATAAEAVGINKSIDLWEAKADAIRNAGKVVEEEIKPAFDSTATTLAGITTNIDILSSSLQTASIEEAANLNKEIALWNKKADAIRNAGKAGAVTFDTFKGGWGAVKSLDGAVRNITETLRGNATVWEKVMAVVEGFIATVEGISAIIGIVNTLSAATKAHAAAKATEAAATATATAADGAAAAAAPVAAAADVPLIAANKAAAASFLEMATAAYMAAHAYIPFAGFGIASGFAASAAAVVKSMGLMQFANGGIAYGPTLGLFGEYAGASSNPEVVAPLDRLQSLLEPREMMAGEVTFRIKGEALEGVLRRRTNHVGRTL